ncbi:MAG TPA: glutamate racemase [Limnochordia bacterium]
MASARAAVLPIGLFDSGLGGLSIALAIRERLPGEDLVYVADSAYCPYGGRPVDEIRRRALAISRFLARYPVKAIVIASNTTTGAAAEAVRAEQAVPVVGVEPAVKPAVALTANRCIGVMATASTLASDRFRRLVAAYAPGVRVIPLPCPGLVEHVESGRLDGPELRALLERLLAPVRRERPDTLVLACTHYPFLRAAIQEVVGPTLRLIETGPPVARQLERVLRERDLLASRPAGRIEMWTTGDPATVGPVAARLWGGPLDVRHLDVPSE